MNHATIWPKIIRTCAVDAEHTHVRAKHSRSVLWLVRVRAVHVIHSSSCSTSMSEANVAL